MCPLVDSLFNKLYEKSKVIGGKRRTYTVELSSKANKNWQDHGFFSFAVNIRGKVTQSQQHKYFLLHLEVIFPGIVHRIDNFKSQMLFRLLTKPQGQKGSVLST